MDREELRQLLTAVRAGSCDIDQAAARLSALPYAELGFAKVDHHRELRCGFAEVIFGPGKTCEDLVAIVERALSHAGAVLSTRLDPAQAQGLLARFPQAIHNPRARTVRVGQIATPLQAGPVAIVSAGTSDLPVAEEAHETLLAFGARTTPLYDVGVAGLHRLLHNLPQLREAKVVIVVAGMEGALPSVVGGMLAAPVIAVPTSVGYGASFGGIAPLLAMLNSCASGVAVVNIDNGFGAAATALRILRMMRD
jgi:NCAIR mutase (PurE)-related protein